MKKFALALLLGSAIFGTAIGGSFAATAAAPATLKCPVCSMPMSATKNATYTEPVYSKTYKKVYYCCPVCKAGKAAAAYYKMHKKPMPV